MDIPNFELFMPGCYTTAIYQYVFFWMNRFLFKNNYIRASLNSI